VIQETAHEKYGRYSHQRNDEKVVFPVPCALGVASGTHNAETLLRRIVQRFVTLSKKPNILNLEIDNTGRNLSV
jgi:hypothetical protein